MARGSFLTAVVLLVLVCVASTSGSLTVKSAEKNIDLTTQVARHSVSFNIVNSGSEPVTEFDYVVQNLFLNKVSLVHAVDESGAPLAVSNPANVVGASGEKYRLYKLKLNKALEPQASSTIRVSSLLTHVQTPHPAQITQSEPQLVRYRDNHYIFSVYPVQSQETKIKFPTGKVVGHTKQKPAQLKGDILKYGPYTNIAPLSVSNMTLHYENNSPFVVARSLVKEYEISAWGNLAVEETYELTHEGAKFTGPFNRIEFQRLGAPSAVNVIGRRLPKHSADIYYRDAIGNISTSHVNTMKDETVRLDLIPRFPLFGGWNISFYIGYNLPLGDFLSVGVDDSTLHVLNVSFAITSSGLVVDDYTLRIIFPEGASDFQPILPFHVDEVTDNTKHFTYLDVSGRPVLVIKKKNIVNEHDLPVIVLFRFSKVSMLLEPLYLIVAFFAIFSFTIIASRLSNYFQLPPKH